MEIIGIAAVDQNGFISANGETISNHENISETSRNLDREFIRHKFSNISNGRLRGKQPLFVVGENTYEEMGKLIQRKDNVIISNNEKAWFASETIDLENGNRLDEFAFSTAFKMGIETIVVLGGKSVFESFRGNYTCFYLTEFETSINGDKKLDKEILPKQQLLIFRNENMSIKEHL